ncbi:TRAP transporter substrate-binding protein [Oceanobacter antarcticus]|uniref:TRAP transporter substrate-binding protein n=1 Tax=Oceanobacter antarcticus TaxID=3133425 RepID=A0ABW8NN76_9GAMM
MKIISNILRSALCFSVSGLITTGQLQAAEFNFKLHHLLPPMSEVHTKIMLPWAEKIEQESNGRIHIDVYPAMQLGGKPAQLFDQARKGSADITWTVAGYTPGRFRKSEVFELPFMASSAEVTSQALQQFATEEMTDDFREVKLLAIHTNATGVLHSRGKGIHKMEDLAGLKIRAPNKAMAEVYALMGASPIFMPAPQMSSALSKGVLDVASLSYDIVGPLKIHELTQSTTEISGDRGLYGQVFLFSMNKKSYLKLPKELQQVIDNNSGIKLAAWMGRILDEMGAKGRTLVKDSGNEIIVLSADETRHWRETAQPVIDAWMDDMNSDGEDGKKLYQRANQLIDQYGRKP